MSNTTASELDFFRFFESLPQPYIILDPDFAVAHANSAYLRLANVSLDQIKNKELLNFYSEYSTFIDKRGKFDLLNSLNQVLINKMANEMEVHRYDLIDSGLKSIKFWKPLNTPIFNELGDVVYIVHQVADVTLHELEKLEKARQEKQLYNLVMDASVAMAIFKGPNYVIEFANPAVCTIWGKSTEYVVGLPLFEALPEAAGQGFEELLTSVITTGIPFIGKELPAILFKNGKNEKVFFDFVYLPVRESDGTISGVSVVANDVTNNVKADKLLKETKELYEQQNEFLVKANLYLDRFVHVASHDLKAPLANIGPIFNLLKEDYYNHILNEEGVTWIDRGLTQVAKMEDLIAELLAIAMNKKKFRQPIVLEELIMEVVDQLNFNNIDLIIQENLPLINYHKTSLMQVFQNLIGNAVKYMDKEEGIIQVNFEVKEEHYEFCISDNGSGIKEEFIPKIFELFQSASENKSIESTGIGLSIVKNIIKEENGDIWVESKEKEGSRFYFTIPKVLNY